MSRDNWEDQINPMMWTLTFNHTENNLSNLCVINSEDKKDQKQSFEDVPQSWCS